MTKLNGNFLIATYSLIYCPITLSYPHLQLQPNKKTHIQVIKLSTTHYIQVYRDIFKIELFFLP